MEKAIDICILSSQPFCDGSGGLDNGLDSNSLRDTAFTRYLGDLLIEQAQKYGIEATANLYRLPQTLLQKLPMLVTRIPLPDKHGAGEASPFLHMYFPHEFKKRIIDMAVEDRRSPSEITKITGVSCSSVKFWIKKYRLNEELKETVSTSERTSRVLVEAFRRLEVGEMDMHCKSVGDDM